MKNMMKKIFIVSFSLFLLISGLGNPSYIRSQEDEILDEFQQIDDKAQTSEVKEDEELTNDAVIEEEVLLPSEEIVVPELEPKEELYGPAAIEIPQFELMFEDPTVLTEGLKTSSVRLNTAMKLNGTSDDIEGSIGIVTIDKTQFLKPELEHISSAGFIESIEILEDATTYQIVFHYTTLVKGSVYGVPFLLYPAHSKLNRQVTIDYVLKGSQGEQLNHTEVTYVEKPVTPEGVSNLTSGTFTILNNQLQDRKLTSEFTWDSPGYVGSGGTEIMMNEPLRVKTNYDRSLLSDTRDFFVEVTLPQGFRIENSPTTVGNWTFDPVTRVAKHTSSGESMKYPEFFPEYRLIIEAGMSIEDIRGAKFSYRAGFGDGAMDPATVIEGLNNGFSVNKEPDWTVEGYINGVFSNGIEEHKHFNVNRLSEGDWKFNITYKPFNFLSSESTNMLQISKVRVKQKQLANAPLDNTYMNQTIKMTADVSPERVVELSKNRIYATNINTGIETEVGRNLPLDTSLSLPVGDIYSQVSIEFNGDILLTKEEAETFTVHSSQELNVDAIREKLMYSEKLEDVDAWMYYTGNSVFQKSPDNEYTNVAEHPAIVFREIVGFDKFETSFTNNALYGVSYASSAKLKVIGGSTMNTNYDNEPYGIGQQQEIENLKIYWVLPNGMGLDKRKLNDPNEVRNLSHVEEIQDYNGSGYTVIVGTPKYSHTSDYYSSNQNGDFKIPLTAKSTLEKSDAHPIVVFAAWDNNKGIATNYPNVGDVAMGNAKTTADLDALSTNMGLSTSLSSLGIGENANQNTVIVSSGTFSYTPPLQVVANTSVKKSDNSIYIEDTGETVFIGEDVSMELAVSNFGLDSVATLDIINVLPRIGDQYQVDRVDGSDKNRGSEFNMYLTGPMSVPEGYKVLYSTETPSDDVAINSGKVFSESVSDYKQVTMIRIQMLQGTSFPKNSALKFHYTLTTDATEDIAERALSRNSFALTIDQGVSYFESSSAVTRITYPTSSLTITTQAKEDASKKLGNAKYKIFNYDTGEEIVQTSTFGMPMNLIRPSDYTSNAQGQVTIDGLVPGTYYIQQVSVDAPYELKAMSKEEGKFTVKKTASEDLNILVENELGKGTINITYVNEFGEPINPDLQLQETDGTVFQYTAPTLEGFTYVKQEWVGSAPINDTIRAFTTYNLKVTYATIPAPVVVHYVDDLGNVLMTSKTVTGLVGQAYDVSGATYKVSIDGYNLDTNKLPSNAIGTISGTQTDVTYIYKRALGTVEITYVDDANNEIKTLDNITGLHKEEITFTQPNIVGYTFASKEWVGEAPTNNEYFGNKTYKLKMQYTRMTQVVNVHYIDDLGTVIKEPQVVSGLYKDAYDVTSATYKLAFEGYDLDTTKLPTNAVGTISSEAIDVTYTYKRAMGHVVITYVNEDGVEIAEKTTLSKVHLETIDYTQPTITGYTYASEEWVGDMPVDQAFFGNKTYSLTMRYTTNPKPVVVHYVDDEGNTIAEDKTIEGAYRSTYDASTQEYKIDIEGYNLDTTKLPNNAIGTILGTQIDVTYVYKKAVGNLVITYVKEDGTSIKEEVTLSQLHNTAMTYTKPSITGFTFAREEWIGEVPTNNTYVGNKTYYLTMHYTTNPEPVLVHYIDENGNTISPDKELTGEFQAPYDVSVDLYKIDIPGYDLDTTKLPTNATGTISGEVTHVTYTYNRAYGTLHISYVNEEGESILDSATFSELHNTAITYDIPNIDGFTYASQEWTTEAPTNNLFFGNTTYELVMHYTTNPMPVYVHYVDENNNVIAETNIVEGNLHDAYDVETSEYKIAIEGYDLDETLLPEHTVGTISSEEIHITYRYNRALGTLLVKYVDENGLSIAETTTLSKLHKEAMEYSVLDIEGYTYASENWVGDEPVDLTFIGNKTYTLELRYTKDKETNTITTGVSPTTPSSFYIMLGGTAAIGAALLGLFKKRKNQKG